jgi:hypothetical protein
MGRPIIAAKNSSEVVQRFFNEIQGKVYISQHKFNFEKILFTGDWKDILSYI